MWEEAVNRSEFRRALTGVPCRCRGRGVGGRSGGDGAQPRGGRMRSDLEARGVQVALGAAGERPRGQPRRLRGRRDDRRARAAEFGLDDVVLVQVQLRQIR